MFRELAIGSALVLSEQLDTIKIPRVASVSTRVAPVPEPYQGTQRGEDPDDRRRGRAVARYATEKPDAAHDLRQHAGGIGLADGERGTSDPGAG